MGATLPIKEVCTRPGTVQAAILDEDTHRAVVAVLADPSRHGAGRPRRYLLSGVARCALCEGRLYGVTEGDKGERYRCELRRHVHLRSEPVDEVVLRFVSARLSRPDAAELLATPDRGEEAAALRERELSLRGRLDGLAAAFAAGESTVSSCAPARSGCARSWSRSPSRSPRSPVTPC